MDRLHVRAGSLVEEDELLTKLSDNSTMWVYFNVPEAEYLDLAMSMKKTDTIPVALELANGKLFNQPGFIETIEADFNNETGNIAFRASFPNPTGLLRHGETGNILIRNPLREALIIPQKATFEVLDKVYVYLLDSANSIHAKEIKIAAEIPHLFVVSEGLDESDTILLEGLRLVQENQVIIPEFVEPVSVLSNLSHHAE
jgi:membrane fusion protein (multidrug efflux system)